MRYFFLITSFVSIGFLSIANAQPRYLSPGYVSGNDYLELTAVQKSDYYMGLVDGILVSKIFLNNEVSSEVLLRVDKLKDCLTTTIVNTKQLGAIIEKYLADNPERWADGMNILFYNSVQKICSLN